MKITASGIMILALIITLMVLGHGTWHNQELGLFHAVTELFTGTT